MDNRYTITTADTLVRRIPKVPSHCKIIEGRIMATSGAFKTNTGEDGLSVDILALTTLLQAVQNPQKNYAGLLKAEVPMNEKYECRHDPKDYNQAHALIVGNTRPIAKKLAAACTVQEVFAEQS
jgi:hypothetical protein